MLLSLNKIRLDAPLGVSGTSLVLAELVLPRNSIQLKSALREVDLEKGKRSLTRAPFYEKGLLKEKVDGPFGLKLSVTRPLPRPALSRFLRQLLGTGIESGADLLGPLAFRNSLISDIVEEAGEYLADAVSDAEPAFVATGGIDLDSEALESGTLNIPLKLSETIRSTNHLKLSEKRAKRRRAAKTYRKGSEIGEVSLKLTTG
jgi:hypothetical protein